MDSGSGTSTSGDEDDVFEDAHAPRTSEEMAADSRAQGTAKYSAGDYAGAIQVPHPPTKYNCL